MGDRKKVINKGFWIQIVEFNILKTEITCKIILSPYLAWKNIGHQPAVEVGQKFETPDDSDGDGHDDDEHRMVSLDGVGESLFHVPSPSHGTSVQQRDRLGK
ncbi:hypothetical protein VNO77_33853 [Canavalia gladiata]|uniref:Uncharacterized protein n=1 Tax=Canavalia gladiata TaxID=3824 RepID=A0AAN9KFH2_CANGL